MSVRSRLVDRLAGKRGFSLGAEIPGQPAVAQRYLLSPRELEADVFAEPGLIQLDDGTVQVVKPDGTREQVGRGSQPTVTGTGPPVAPQNSSWILYFNVAPSSGAITISFRGHTSAPIPWNATPSEVIAALEALPSIGAGNVVALNGDLFPDGLNVMFVGALGQAATEDPAIASDTSGASAEIDNNQIGNAGAPPEATDGTLYGDTESGLSYFLSATGDPVTSWRWFSCLLQDWAAGDNDHRALLTGGHFIGASFNAVSPKTLKLYDDAAAGANAVLLDPVNGLLIDSNVRVYFFVGEGTPVQIYFDPSEGLVVTMNSNDYLVVTPDGRVMLSHLPTTDPHVADQLWNSSGTVKVSAGP